MIIAYLINEQFSYIMATTYIRWDDDEDDDDNDDDDVRFVLD